MLTSPYTFLPGLVETVVAHDLQARMGLRRLPEVRLSSNPPYSMLFGEFSSGTVQIRDADFGNVHARRVEMRLKAFNIDLLRSLFSGHLESRGPVNGRLQVVLSEGEIRRIAASSVGGLPVDGIKLMAGEVGVWSRVVLAGVEVPVSVVGSVAVQDGRIVFSPQRISAFGLELPQKVAGVLLSGISFSYPVEDLPFPVRLTSIEVSPEDILLQGRLTIPPG